MYSAFFPSGFQIFTVESFDAEAMNRESGDHVTWYTAPTCPFSVLSNLRIILIHHSHFPVKPSHTFTFLSNDAEAMYRPSGEKHM